MTLVCRIIADKTEKSASIRWISVIRYSASSLRPASVQWQSSRNDLWSIESLGWRILPNH